MDIISQLARLLSPQPMGGNRLADALAPQNAQARFGGPISPTLYNQIFSPPGAEFPPPPTGRPRVVDDTITGATTRATPAPKLAPQVQGQPARGMGPMSPHQQNNLSYQMRDPGQPGSGGLLGGRTFASSMAPDRTGGTVEASQERSAGSGIIEGLRDLLDGGEGRKRNMTVDWLQKKGYSPDQANYLVQDKQALQGILRQHVMGSQPDWQMQTIYDGQGREQRVMMDMNNPDSIRPIGGSKSDLISQEAEQQKARIAAAGRTSIDLGSSEKEYDRSVGKAYGERFTGLQTDAQSAGRAINALTVMEQAMDQPGFYSGTGSGIVQYGKRFAASVGLDPDGVKDMESFSAMSKQAALDAMGGSLGSGFSNADRSFVLDQVPTLANTFEGNKQLIGIQKKLAVRKQDIAKLARQYAKENAGRIDAGFDDYLSSWAERNPLFPTPPATDRGDRVGGRERVNNPAQPGSQPPIRATNPQTGETIELRNGQWAPVQ